MGLLLWSIVFVVSLAALIVSADFFIKASERVGLALGISPFVIGITLVALGTSLPELVTSIAAVLSPSGSSVIVPGNVIGSNITNMGLVLGLVGILAKRIKLQFDVARVDLPMMLGATFLLYICLQDFRFTLFEAIVCLAGMAIYLAYVISLSRNEKERELPALENLDEIRADKEEERASAFSWREAITLLSSGAVIFFSAKYNVLSIEELAGLLGIGKEFIALTVVALGTSLPELVVSIVAVRTNNAEMAIGNVLGSNIFNIFAVMGIPRLFGVILVPESILEFSLPVLIAMSLLCFFVLMDREINRWESWILFLLYLLYIINLATQEILST